jgi:hypothetical protein
MLVSHKRPHPVRPRALGKLRPSQAYGLPLLYFDEIQASDFCKGLIPYQLCEISKSSLQLPGDPYSSSCAGKCVRECEELSREFPVERSSQIIRRAGELIAYQVHCRNSAVEVQLKSRPKRLGSPVSGGLGAVEPPGSARALAVPEAL